MTAHLSLLVFKYADVISVYAEQRGVTVRAAMDLFYRSRVYQEMREGVSDMHCRGDLYLAEELWRESRIITADPAGNITVFVLDPPKNKEARISLAKTLLADPALKAEQVGFADLGAEIPRLEMMGGEFCGNAARSFGLLVARERGLGGKGEAAVRVSGMAEPLTVRFDREAGTASVEIPPPVSRRELRFQDQPLALYEFDGISHIIAPDFPPEQRLFEEIRGFFEADCRNRGCSPPDALGVMFWDSKKRFMSPAVYVYGTASLVFESSCGSGSAAMGLYLGESLQDGRVEYAVSQKGGLIQVTLEKAGGKTTSLSIGGPVGLA